MNREIKFKIWDNVDYMSSPVTLEDLQNRKVQFTSGCKVIQFTGLRDKSGREIYEGDIVKWDDMSNGEKWRVAVVEINPDITFRIVRVNLDLIQSAREGHVFRYGGFIYTDTENHFHIIGNIYENPELL